MKLRFLTHPFLQIISFFCIIFYGQTIPFFYFLTFISGLISTSYYAIFAIIGTVLILVNFYYKNCIIQIMITCSYFTSLALFITSRSFLSYSEGLNRIYTLLTLFVFIFIQVISIFYSLKKEK